MTLMDKEILDIVDLSNRVIWQATREEIYTKKHIHRIVHVIIRNKKWDFLMQLRSEKSKYLPLHWSTSVGWHVDTGEDFEVAARREMREEIGIERLDFINHGVFFYEGDGLQKFLGVFEGYLDEGFVCNPDEVSGLEFMDYNKSCEVMHSGKVHPELKFLWGKLYQ